MFFLVFAVKFANIFTVSEENTVKGSLSTSVHCGRLLLLSSRRLDIFHSTNDTICADLPSSARSTCNLSVTI